MNFGTYVGACSRSRNDIESRLGALNDEAQPLDGAVGRWGAQAPTHKTFEKLGMKGAWCAKPRPQVTIFGFGENIFFLNFKC